MNVWERTVGQINETPKMAPETGAENPEIWGLFGGGDPTHLTD